MSTSAATEPAFFTPQGDTLVPTALSRSAWSADQLHGVAVSGVLGRCAERALDELGRPGLRPARLVVDLFRPTRMAPCLFVTELVREGSRLALVDVTLVQDGEAVARASLTCLAVSAATEGRVWAPTDRPGPPPTHVAPPTDTPHQPWLRSVAGWSQERTQHQNAAHKTSWSNPPAVVAGERRTPFQAAAAMADGTNLVVGWGDRGVEYINADLTLTLARLPRTTEIGLAALDRIESDGIAVGAATMFDREGVIGTVTTTAIANARRAVTAATMRPRA